MGRSRAEVEVSRAAGGIDLTLRVVDAAAVQIIGAAPKAASAVRSDLRTGCVRAMVVRGDHRRVIVPAGDSARGAVRAARAPALAALASVNL